MSFSGAQNYVNFGEETFQEVNNLGDLISWLTYTYFLFFVFPFLLFGSGTRLST